MEIFTLLETLEDMLEKSRNVPFSGKCVVDKEEILDIIDPLKFIGRAPSQVVEFIDEYVTPIINENKDALD